MAASLVIRWVLDAMPRKAKPEARTRSYMVDELPITSQQTICLHSEAHALEEAGSLSVPR